MRVVPMVHRLLDGEVFEIKVSDEACVRSWMEGDLDEILGWIREGRIPILRKDTISIVVKGTTRFDVKRPDVMVVWIGYEDGT
jgi:hypothetical protein